MKSHSDTTAALPRDAGFGMIEIVVSMLLISLLAIAFLPMLVTSLRVSASTTTLASATQLVAAQMEGLRAADPTCEAVTKYAEDLNLNPPVLERQGEKLRPHIEVVGCPVASLDTVSVGVWVDDSTTTRLVQATTLIFVTS
ncbi:hypothetical protein [Cryobacterium sp. PH31-L1]|uniref:type IV pilus modification PilV family protein n=1 Tax=Cryobacterium sp. PH31-L1 TaxID=3046199 RepID=UPI0024BB3316|nr:hypothetical protein [Cryobacterium sp. PH31-L1]MDJ0376020.1 hypothetical protein [Cryobacterium sp. PH31-L1]